MNPTIIRSAEEGLRALKRFQPSKDWFHMAIADDVTFAGEPDTIGAALAVLTDDILGKGYAPAGFEQKAGYRIYKFTRMS